MAREKQLIKNFSKILSEELDKRLGNNYNVEQVIYHLCERGIISEKTIRDRMIVYEYPIKLSTAKFGNTEVCKEISYKYEISERRFYQIIKNKNKFSANYNVSE